MRIAVEAVGNRAGGGAAVLLETIDALLAESPVQALTIFCLPFASRGFPLPADSRIHAVELAAPDRSPLRRILWLEFDLPRRLAAGAFDAVLLINGAGRVPSSIPSIAFYQQAIPLTPESFASVPLAVRLRFQVLRFLYRRAARRASRIAVQRPGMKTLLVDQFRMDPARIEVFEPGPPPFPTAHDLHAKLSALRAVAPDRRILYVGSAEPHKRIEVAARAAELVSQSFPGSRLFATCAPPPSMARLDSVCWLGFLDRAELRMAYELSSMLIMPSDVESLGLPLLEAMSLGLPIVAADRSYARDVCGSAALFFAPGSADDAARKLVALFRNHDLRNSLSAAGLQIVRQRQSSAGYRQLARRLIRLSSSL